MKIGFVCSCFDLLHSGHLLMLQEAKSKCDFLIAGLQTDSTIDRPESKNKPIQSIVERFIQLDGVKYVDKIIPYESEKDLLDILNSIKIDIRIMGEEYKDKEFTGKGLPIEIYFNSRKHGFSTSELRKRLKAN